MASEAQLLDTFAASVWTFLVVAVEEHGGEVGSSVAGTVAGTVAGWRELWRGAGMGVSCYT